MLNNKLVLCIGNNTAQTDQLTQQQAISNHTINYGLVYLFPEQANKGFYHTSLADCGDVSTLLALADNFDHIIFFKQPASTYDDETAYTLTSHAVSLIEIRLEKPTSVIEIE